MSSATTIAFRDQPVGGRLIEMIVEAGIKAPSAQNRQPWHFSVLTNGDLMEEMNAAASARPSGRAGPGGPAGSGAQPAGGGPCTLLRRAFELAAELDQPSVYDTLYLAAAEREHCDLWTADARFARVASARYPFVRPIGSP